MIRYIVGAYIRLSQDDNYNESDSINNQKKIIEQFINEHEEFELGGYYIDNGYSGTNFDRPDFIKLCFDIAKDKINCVIVKDLSRFGRDSAWVKIYLGETFPKYNVRFISINDHLDNLNDLNFTDDLEFSLLNLIHEQYAVDISKKISTVKHMQQKKGEFIGVSAPYGYLKNPDDCHKFIIDKYAASIVKRIFDLALEPRSKAEIADILNNEKILTPSRYKSEITRVTSNKTVISDKWNAKIISEILKNETYVGTLIQGRSKRNSRRNRKLIKTDKNEWKICNNHHEPIINKCIFDDVQRLLNYSKIVLEENEVLISKLICHECKSGVYRKKAKDYYYYICKSKYRNLGCNLKPFRKDILEDIILLEINDRYNKNYKKLTKEIVDKYISKIELHKSDMVNIIYNK